MQLQPATCAICGCNEVLTNVSHIPPSINWVANMSQDCWTTLRHQLLGNENLGGVGMSLGLDACINANGGTVRITAGMIVTALEAVLGAVERDGGHNALASVMDHLGLTRHALLSPVTSSPPYPLPLNISAAIYSLDILGPLVAAQKLSLAWGP
jgi:hypothetical protein